jgi:hypothetical protein
MRTLLEYIAVAGVPRLVTLGLALRHRSAFTQAYVLRCRSSAVQEDFVAMEQVDARSLWTSLLAHTRELIPLRAAAIRVDRNSLVDAARASLRNLQENRPGLEALAYLDPGFTLDLLEDILDRAESHRDAGVAKQVLGRLPRAHHCSTAA